MKIIHSADWHLGQTFYGYDRKEEHVCFLNRLLHQLKTLQADVLLIAGDVFDSSNPSAESQKLFYGFLRDATMQNPQLQIVVISGNHDSAARLEAPNPLLETMNITVNGVVKRTLSGEIAYQDLIVPLRQNGTTAAWCLAVPYLRFGDYPLSETYSDGVKKLFSALYEHIPDKSLPVVAMAHLQASGATVSRNDKHERMIIGGEEGVSEKAIPAIVTYTALGHLHKAQHLPNRENARYAGARLPMSFAERNNKQGIVLVEISDDETKIEKIEISPLIKLQSINVQSIDELFQELKTLPEGDKTNAPYLEIIIKIDQPEPALRSNIEAILETKTVRLAKLVCRTETNEEKSTNFDSDYDGVVQVPKPFDMAVDVFKRQYGGDDMPDNMKKLLQEVILEINNEEI